MELKFYSLNHALEKVGCVPQVVSVKKTPATPLVEFVGSWDILPKKEASVRIYPLIARTLRTKFTDLLSCYSINGSGAIINERLKNIFSEYNFGCQYQYTRVSIVTKKGESISTPYYHLHLPMPGIVDKIDYSKSTFYETRFDKRLSDTPIKIKSYEDRMTLQKNLSKKDICAIIQSGDVVLKKGTDPKMMDIFDWLGNPCGGGLFMISERLKQRLEKEKITGIAFEEYPYTISIDD